MSDYTELQIKINPEIEDIVSDICFEYLPCEGVVLAEEAYKDLEMISTTEGTLKVFLTSNPENVSEILKEQRELLKARGLSDSELGSWEFVISNKPNEDWSKKWKEKWTVTHVSDRITVVPDWIEYSAHRDDEVVIKLEPGCAFGTGTHQTTQLCMKAIEKYMPSHASVADIGMGSGILAICAKKFGATSVYGCDNDETVIEVAKENAIKNQAQCVFELNTADKISEKFDFVLANILHNVLAEIMGDLKNIMNNGAIMVLSGILDEKKPVVLDAIKKHGLELVEEAHQDQWVALIVKK
jgi:ribosomal protein L11 methyltransferase